MYGTYNRKDRVYKEGSLCFNIQFFVEKIKKGKENFDPPQLGFEPQILEQNFPAQDLNFEGRLDQLSSRFLKNLDFNQIQHNSAVGNTELRDWLKY